ncbi:MAG: hypothetical protein ACK5LN_10545 [Propioniciclava sp.]
MTMSVLGGAVLAGMLAYAGAAFRADQAIESLAGAQVVTIGHDTDPRVLIARASCERLSRLPIVAGSGVVNAREYREFPTVGQVATVQVSSTLVRFDHADVVIGADLATSVGLGSRGHLIGADGDVYTYSVADQQPEGVDTNGSILTPVVGQEWTRSCVVRLVDGVRAQEALPFLLAQLRYLGDAPATVQADGRSGHSSARYRGGVDRWAALAVALLLGGCLGLFRRLRPAEAVSYRLAGMRRSELARLHFLEDGTCAALFNSSAIALLIVLEPPGLLMLSHVLWLIACGCGLMSASMLASLSVVLPSPLALGSRA